MLAEMSLGQRVYMTGEGGGLNKGANKGRSFRNSESPVTERWRFGSEGAAQVIFS